MLIGNKIEHWETPEEKEIKRQEAKHKETCRINRKKRKKRKRR